jgi:hypothetical protein
MRHRRHVPDDVRDERRLRARRIVRHEQGRGRLRASTCDLVERRMRDRCAIERGRAERRDRRARDRRGNVRR